jgi:hypothetical protein
MRPWYIWHKPCTCLALKLTLSLDGPKRASIWASSPRSTIGIQNNFWAYSTFDANRAPIMHRNWHCTQKNKTSFHLSLVTLEYHPVCPIRFLRLWYIWRKLCIYLALKFTLPPNGLKWASNWASSPRCTIRCMQNSFWAYGTFGAIRAPIKHWN